MKKEFEIEKSYDSNKFYIYVIKPNIREGGMIRQLYAIHDTQEEAEEYVASLKRKQEVNGWIKEYKTKPTIKLAMRFNGTNLCVRVAKGWLKDKLIDVHYPSSGAKGQVVGMGGEIRMKIGTLEGPHICIPGDYIVQGIKGEFYPVKADIFERSYEEVKE